MHKNAAEIYTVAFADIVGSTPLYETVGDSLPQTLITDLEHKIAELVIHLGGVFQQFVGDEFVCYFADVNAAVDCACKVHEAAEAFSGARGVPMTMRIGLHYGPAVNHLKDELRAKARDFDYTDISTNGRYVQTQDGEPIYLRRKTLPL